MIQPTPNYLRLHVEPETAPRTPPSNAYRGLPGLCQAFEQATGWKLQHLPAPPESPRQSEWPDTLRDKALLATQLCLQPAAPRPAVPAPEAQRLADGVAQLLDDLLAARSVIWQREAELAAGVPIVACNDESRRLAQRLEAVLQAGVEAVGCQAASLHMLDANTTQLKLRSVWNLPCERFFDPPRPLATATADLEALSGHAVVLEKADLSRSWNVPEQFAAAVCVPVSSSTVPLGTLWLFAATERTFTDQELNIIEVVGGRLAAELERQMLLVESQSVNHLKRQVARAHEVCHQQSQRIAPRLEGWDVAGWAAQGHEVGGAFYDWHMHADGRLSVALGEAAGGGIVAALGAQSLRAAFRAHAEYAAQPHVLLECLNRSFWSQSAGDQWAALWCATIEPRDGLLSYAWAGRPGLLQLRPERQERICDPQAALGLEPQSGLGLEPQSGYARHQASIEPGEALVVFSEHIRAALDDRGRPLDLAALTTMLIDHLNQSAAELSELVRAFLESHGLDPDTEDRAVLVLKRCGRVGG